MPAVTKSDSKEDLIERVGFKKYFKAERWEDFNRQFFDGLAPKYDFINEILTFGRQRAMRKKVIAEAAIAPSSLVLDLCTGTGEIAVLIGQTYPGARIIAIDASERMLEIAGRRAEGLHRVRFQRADALCLPFNDGRFDVTIISFGLRNLRDLEKGLLEMKRVTAPGGRIVNLDLGKPRGTLKRLIYELYFMRFIPFLGATVFHRGEFNSLKYLPESNRSFPSQGELVSIFRGLGLKDVRNFDFLCGAVAAQIGTV